MERGGQNTRRDIWLVPVLNPEQARPLLATQAEEFQARFSPDSRWIAFCSDLSGRFKVYVQPVSGSGARIQISRAGGRLPVWSRSGNELFFIARENSMSSAAYTIDSSGVIRFEAPKHLFDLPERALSEMGSLRSLSGFSAVPLLDRCPQSKLGKF
jgi:hypothetical protein